MFDKYIIYAILAAIAIAIITGGYFAWKSSIKQEALLEWNNKQLQQVVEEQKKYNENMQFLKEKQADILESVNKKNQEVANKFNGFNEYLRTEETKKFPESSDVLKKAIDAMRDTP